MRARRPAAQPGHQAMKLVLLRGGQATAAMPGPDEGAQAGLPRPDSATCGVTAIGSGGQWVLVNISSAVARQLAQADANGLAAAWPGLDGRQVRAVVLTDPQIEHAAGLLGLRQGPALELYTTPAVFEELTVQLPVLPALQHYCGVHWHVVPVAGDRRSAPFRIEALPTLEFTAYATVAPPWPHLAHQRAVVGDSIALAVRDLATGMSVYCAPGLVRPGPEELRLMQHSDCVLLDGPGRAQDPASPALEWMQRLPARHKVLMSGGGGHTPALARRGFELAHDGMEIDL